MSKKKTNEVLKKKEHFSFTKKFTPKQLVEKEKEFSILCVEKSKKESLIEKYKDEVKNSQSLIRRLSSVIEDGGVDEYEECDVEVHVGEMKKKYFYEGELVGEEDADENDLQTEITEE